MIHESTTTLSAAEVITRAKAFFDQRVPNNAAPPASARSAGSGGPRRLKGALLLSGAVKTAIARLWGVSRVRASTLFFDQAVARFLSTLPEPAVLT